MILLRPVSVWCPDDCSTAPLASNIRLACVLWALWQCWRWCSDHDGVAIRQCTLPLSRDVCSPSGRTEFHLFSFVETNRRIPSQHTDLWVVYTVFFVTPPLSRHLSLSEPLVRLCTSPGQIGPRPRRVVVRKSEHAPCLAERGDAEWRPEICINPLYRSRRTF